MLCRESEGPQASDPHQGCGDGITAPQPLGRRDVCGVSVFPRTVCRDLVLTEK